MSLLLHTNNRLLALGILLLRCITGLILFVGGAGKVLGWFGGMGLKTTVEAFKPAGISAPWAYISSFTEFICGFLLIIGLLTRPAAFLIMINMLVAVIVVGTKAFFAGGAAYPFSLMINAIVILLAGPMAYSLDAALWERRKLHPASLR